jgi:SAM-dependent methyltransferase
LSPIPAAAPVTPDEQRVHPQRCEACGGSLRVRFATVRDPQTRETFSIVECAGCGLGHTSPRPANLARYYRDYHGGRHGQTASYCARRRSRILRQVAVAGNTSVALGDSGADPSARRLLDIGCGDGTFLLAARAAGWSVVGTEMNVVPARAAGLDVYHHISDLHSQAPFHAITLWHTFEHVPHPRAAPKEIRSLLAPNGTLIIAVPDAGGLQARAFGPYWFHLDPPRHLHHFTRASLSNLLQAEGFLPFREWHQEFEYDLLGWSQSALNRLTPAHPNLFFNQLRGFHPAQSVSKPAGEPLSKPVSKPLSVATFLAGSLLTAFSTLLIPLGSLTRLGGTLVLSAHPK